MPFRFRGNANNGNCSRRNLNANNAASNANRNNGGSANVKHVNFEYHIVDITLRDMARSAELYKTSVQYLHEDLFLHRSLGYAMIVLKDYTVIRNAQTESI